ncbi:PKD-like family lipoprotein [Longitalea luteola]|uniref:PKD-like family lipoprotein n=1 Tax=Longitalea luteola TaxID=2812563 RepID=UPI001A97B025|nr:PKD-like family lipoprotein [Longitalea luteola]
MTKRYINIYIFCLAALVLAACYKDKGNYDYQAINEVTLKTDREAISLILPDSLKVNVTIEQTIPDPAGFSFEWVLYLAGGTPLERRVLDTTQNLKARITELPGSYYLMLYAKDRKTGVEYQKRLVVSVLTAYSEGWMVVEENNGACDISMISPVDTIFRNIYSTTNNGQKLPAGTFRIPEIKTHNGDQKIYIISPADMIQVTYSDFKKLSTFNEFFWEPPVPKPQEYFVNGTEDMMLNNGKIHSRSLNAPSGANKLNLPPSGNHFIAPYELYSVASGYVVFDTVSQSFLKLNASSSSLTPFPTPSGTRLFYLNNIGKKLLYAELNASPKCYAYFKNNDNDSLFAYGFNPAVTNPDLDKTEILSAPGLIDARLFVGSRTLPHLYYVSGHQIYKLDVPAKTAAPVYSFPAGTEIRAMKMYRNLKLSTDSYNNKLIAVATHENGEGKVYYFPISPTGSFVNNTYSKVFTGFNKINEITFKSLK